MQQQAPLSERPRHVADGHMQSADLDTGQGDGQCHGDRHYILAGLLMAGAGELWAVRGSKRFFVPKPHTCSESTKHDGFLRDHSRCCRQIWTCSCKCARAHVALDVHA